MALRTGAKTIFNAYGIVANANKDINAGENPFSCKNTTTVEDKKKYTTPLGNPRKKIINIA